MGIFFSCESTFRDFDSITTRHEFRNAFIERDPFGGTFSEIDGLVFLCSVDNGQSKWEMI